jgi:hypothetical protein
MLYFNNHILPPQPGILLIHILNFGDSVMKLKSLFAAGTLCAAISALTPVYANHHEFTVYPGGSPIYLAPGVQGFVCHTWENASKRQSQLKINYLQGAPWIIQIPVIPYNKTITLRGPAVSAQIPPHTSYAPITCYIK